MYLDRYTPKDNPSMSFHRFFTRVALPIILAVCLFEILKSAERFNALSMPYSILALIEIFLFSAQAILIILTDLLLIIKSRNGIRMLIVLSLYSPIINIILGALTHYATGEPAGPISKAVSVSLYLMFVACVYYAQRSALFYDTQVCFNCGQKVRDIEPVCPHCRRRWNDPYSDPVPPPDGEPLPEPAPEPTPMPEPAPEPGQAQSDNERVYTVLLIIVGLLILSLVAFIIYVFKTGAGDGEASPSPSPSPAPTMEIASVYKLMSPDYAYLDDGEDFSALRVGDTGNDVHTLQRALIATGYLDGVPDGVYGPKTRDAVAAFQARYLPGEPDYATARTIAYLLLGPGLDEFMDECDPYQYPYGRDAYIAPFSGRAYHSSADCQALRDAIRVFGVPLDYAKAQNYSPCGLCW